MRIGSTQKHVQDKDNLEKIKTQVDRDIESLNGDSTLRRQIESIIPLAAAFITLFLIIILIFFQIQNYFFSDNGSEEGKNNQAVDIDEENNLIDDTLMIGEIGVSRVIKLNPNEAPVITNLINLEKVGYRKAEEVHIVASALSATSEVEELILFLVRDEILKIESIESRTMFLETHLKDVDIALSRSVSIRNALETRRKQLNEIINQKTAEYTENINLYNQSVDNYIGNEAEKALDNLLNLNQEIAYLDKKEEAFDLLQEKLTAYEAILRKKKLAIQENSAALIAGVQVTLVDDVDLGLIKEY